MNSEMKDYCLKVFRGKHDWQELNFSDPAEAMVHFFSLKDNTFQGRLELWRGEKLINTWQSSSRVAVTESTPFA